MSFSIWVSMFRAATARVILRRPAGALVIAALAAAALLWAGSPAPAGAQQSSDTRNRAEKPWLGREISAVKPRRTESGTIAVRAGPRRKWP